MATPYATRVDALDYVRIVNISEPPNEPTDGHQTDLSEGSRGPSLPGHARNRFEVVSVHESTTAHSSTACSSSDVFGSNEDVQSKSLSRAPWVPYAW